MHLGNRVDVSVARVTRPRSVATTKEEQVAANTALTQARNHDDTVEFEFDSDFDFDSSDDGKLWVSISIFN